MVSLSDIAEELQVSVSLVSKVLNDRLGTTGARPELIEAIRRKAEELNYRKNTSALALLKGRQDVFGVFVHRAGNPGSGLVEGLLQGISAEATKFQQRQLLDFYTTGEEFLAFREMMHRGIMDGMVIGGLPHDELVDELLELMKGGMPIVTVHEREIHPEIPNVALDDVEVGRLATEHLIKRGCKRIAHIVDFKERFEGYRTALKQYGLPFDEELVYDDGEERFDDEKGASAARQFLDRAVVFDGLVAQSDEEAVAATNVFCDTGRRVPEEIRVTGVDNAPYCRFSRVPLTSVSLNSVGRGELAVQMLAALLAGEKVASTSVQPLLHPRLSSE